MAEDEVESNNQSPFRTHRWMVAAVVVCAVFIVGVFLNMDRIQDWRYPERVAYDSGYRSGALRANTSFDNLNCMALLVDESLMAPSEFEEHLGRFDDMLRGWIVDDRAGGQDKWEAEFDRYFVAGWWDAFIDRCEMGIDGLSFTGRP